MIVGNAWFTTKKLGFSPFFHLRIGFRILINLYLFHNVIASHVLGSQRTHFWRVCGTKITHKKVSHCVTNTYEASTFWNKYMLINTLNTTLVWEKIHVKQNRKVKVLTDLSIFGVLKWLNPYMYIYIYIWQVHLRAINISRTLTTKYNEDHEYS